jgi:lysozyme
VTADEIRGRQALLRELGLDPGPVDGIWGPRSQSALEAARAALSGAGGHDPIDENTRLLIAELERDEGRVLHAYQDSLGFLTIGIGRLIDKRRGGGISNEEADYLKRNDIARIRRELDAALPWWRRLDPVRQRAIQNMTFQLGIETLVNATGTMGLVRDGRYAEAAARLRGWKWVSQTPARANRVIRMLETGRA